MKTYDHTILLAHGSRDPRWAQPFERLVERLQSRHNHVSLAFMELAQPDLEAIVADVLETNPDAEIAVLPLFFAAGRHLREDVPKEVATLNAQYGTDITLLPPVGELDVFADFLETLISGQLSRVIPAQAG